MEFLTMDSRKANGDVVSTVSMPLLCSTTESTFSTQPPSHHAAITPGRRTLRNERLSWLRHHPIIPSSHILLLFFLTCCLSLTTASPYIEIDEQMVEVNDVGVTSKLLAASLEKLARTGTILVDQRPPPPQPNSWVLANVNDDLKKRDDPFGNAPATTSKTTPSSAKSSSSTKTSSAIINAATQDATTTLPIPYDQGFSGNITDSCSNFMNGFLQNSTFKACLPFSMLLQNSNTFFDVTKSAFKITQTLDATCSADTSVCTPLMASLATEIATAANCASDLASQNPLITQAQRGLKAYKPLYAASCLRNPQTASYCFADAITNASSPTDSYIYYLPLNISLPGGSQPTCNACLKSSMAVFSAASSDRTSAIASTYLAAAQQINVQCGPNFVNSSLAAAATNGGSTLAPSGLASSNLGIIALVMLVTSWLL